MCKACTCKIRQLEVGGAVPPLEDEEARASAIPASRASAIKYVPVNHYFNNLHK